MRLLRPWRPNGISEIWPLILSIHPKAQAEAVFRPILGQTRNFSRSWRQNHCHKVCRHLTHTFCKFFSTTDKHEQELLVLMPISHFFLRNWRCWIPTSFFRSKIFLIWKRAQRIVGTSRWYELWMWNLPPSLHFSKIMKMEKNVWQVCVESWQMLTKIVFVNVNFCHFFFIIDKYRQRMRATVSRSRMLLMSKRNPTETDAHCGALNNCECEIDYKAWNTNFEPMQRFKAKLSKVFPHLNTNVDGDTSVRTHPHILLLQAIVFLFICVSGHDTFARLSEHSLCSVLCFDYIWWN